MIDMTTLSLASVTRSYNVVAVALGETEVRKFSDKTSAYRRLVAICDRAIAAGLTVAQDSTGTVTEVYLPQVDPRDEEIAAGTDVEDAIIENDDEPSELQTDAVTDASTDITDLAPASSEPRSASTLDLSQKIEVLVENPKRKGSRARAIFALYVTGQTGDEFVAAVEAAGHTTRVALANLHWDLDHGFVNLA